MVSDMSLLDARLSRTRKGGPSFTRRHRIYRAAWNVTWALLGRWTPVPLHRWRRLLLMLFGAEIHPTAKVYPSTKIWYPANLRMYEYSCLASNVTCYCMDVIEIGPYALVSQGAYLCGGTHDIDDPNFPLITRSISIHKDAWIAAEAFVGPGVVVGEGAVLGARACSFKPLEPNTVYVGNPAVAVRNRKKAGDKN